MLNINCPEGHDHTSNCRRNGCPCNEHKHTIIKELFDMVYQWGRVGVVVDQTAPAFLDKLRELEEFE